MNKWPEVNKGIIDSIETKMVVQVNGRTRDVINIERNLEEAEVNILVKKSIKANKHLSDKKIIKTIFIKNKIINFIIKN